jgi:hypothetical protein
MPYSIEHTFEIYIHLIVPNANDRETVSRQLRVARLIF